MSIYAQSTNLNSREIEELRKCLCLKTKTYNKNETIMLFSDNAEDLGIVDYGMAYLIRTDFEGQRSIIDYYEEGNIFGKKLSSEINIYSYYIVAREKTGITYINFEKLLTRCGNKCDKHIHFMNTLITEAVQKSQMHIDILSQRSTRSKLMTYFEYMKDRKFKNTFTIPLSLSDLADYLTVDRSAMMRELKKMNDDGLIVSNKREVQMLKNEYNL